jgi:EAL domain-containing protein (putative c-di-GMP-specific phosphodiesterase class I)
MNNWAGADRPDGLLPKEDFAGAAQRLMREAQEAGLSLRVDLVEFKGLDLADAGEGAADVRRRVAATLRANSYNGEGASELAPDRFAVLRSAGASSADLDEQIREASGGAANPVVAELALTGASIDENMRALRYALDQYISDGAQATSLNFTAVVQKTAMDTVRLKAALASRSWSLVYQPVVSLQDESLHHFEALARFEAGASPQASICLAEELGLIADLDLAVVRKVAAVLSKQPPNIEIAANLSAVSLMLPSFQKALAAVTERDTRLRPRLLLELTETHRLTDLEGANRAIQSLRKLGHSVCLDDFGAGAASLDYLRLLEVDFIKFDGRYIRALKVDSRDEVILRHMVNLCRELGIETIAEMIETSEVARLAQSLGVGLGQGWCFARPAVDLVYPLTDAAVPSRRRGATETWG